MHSPTIWPPAGHRPTMHPILFEIVLPHWRLPLSYALLGGALLAVVVALLGWRARARDVVLLGAIGGVLAAIFAVRTRGESFVITDLPIHGYGALLACAFILGWVVSVRLASRSGIPRASAANAYFATTIGALVGARVLYVLTNLGQFHSIGAALDVASGGLVAYGGFLGGLAGAWCYGRISGAGLLGWADNAAPAVLLGLFVTRIGCYLSGCDFGRPLGDGAPAWLQRIGTFPRWDLPSLPLGTGAPAWQWHVERGLIDFDATASLPVHPTQLYESCVGLVLFAGLLWVWSHRRFPGQVLLTGGAAYGIARFLLEFWRDDPERGAWGPAWTFEIGIAVALLIFGFSAAVGPVSWLSPPKWRRLAQFLALLPSPVVYWLARTQSTPGGLVSRWSTSQWLGLLSVVASCIAWVWLSGARTPPDTSDGAANEDGDSFLDHAPTDVSPAEERALVGGESGADEPKAPSQSPTR